MNKVIKLLGLGLAILVLSFTEEKYSKNLSENKNSIDSIPLASILKALPSRHVGPLGGGGNGRISDIAVYEKNSLIFFVATSSGGVFKTTDGGRTFKVFFDQGGTIAIGAIAVCQTNPELVWVGTGEGWHRNSAQSGDGIYKTMDGGKTWQNMGLEKSGSFSKILIHPKNENIVFAAVLGNQWGYGPDRGVYKSEDAGKSWRKVLYVDEHSGAADLGIDTKNPRNLLATLWDHQRLPYTLRSIGSTSGIYHSTDGGNTWRRISKGLPAQPVGRIAIDYFRKNPKYVAACIEESMAPKGVAYLCGFYTSSDGGQSWTKKPAVHYDDDNPAKLKQRKEGDTYWGRPFYDQLIRYDPTDVNRIYHGTFRHVTTDGGKTFVGSTADQHALWINPDNPNHAIEGNDAGIAITWNATNRPITSVKCELPGYGELYGVGYDTRKLYWVAANSQDLGTHLFPTQARQGGIFPSLTESLPGNEGGTVFFDPNDWSTIYHCGRNGQTIFRINLRDNSSTDISPLKDLKLSPLGTGSAYEQRGFNEKYKKTSPRIRASWYAPLILSPWDSKIIYFGANYLFKSEDRGNTWKVISPDLTHDKVEWQIPSDGGGGAQTYQAIVSISESSVTQNEIWIGTDCGYVQLTRDGGKSWINVTKNIPDLTENAWCTKIISSSHQRGRAYACFNNFRNFEDKTYIYATEDFGKTWVKLIGNLPKNLSNTAIIEGLINPNLLILGTTTGLWISLNRGFSWEKYKSWQINSGYGTTEEGYLPNVQVSDLQIHPRESELIVGTHGRGIWIIPIRSLEELGDDHLAQNLFFSTPGKIYNFPTAQTGEFARGEFIRNSQPGTFFSYYLSKTDTGTLTIRITDSLEHNTYANLVGPQNAGLNTIQWLLTRPRKVKISPGIYKVILETHNQVVKQKVEIIDATEEILPPFIKPNAEIGN